MQSNFSSHQPFPWEAARPFLIICSVMLSLSSLIPYIHAEMLQPDTLDFSVKHPTQKSAYTTNLCHEVENGKLYVRI